MNTQLSTDARNILLSYNSDPLVFAKKWLNGSLQKKEDALFASEIVTPVILQAAENYDNQEKDDDEKEKADNIIANDYDGNIMKFAKMVLSGTLKRKDFLVAKMFLTSEILEAAKFQLETEE